MSYNEIKVAHIVATDINGCIGKAGQMPWHVPADLKRFKELTKGGVVIMGRKTFESLGCKPLPDRQNIIVTQNEGFIFDNHKDGLWFCRNLIAAMDLSTGYAKTVGLDTIWIIGGGEIYYQTMPYVDVIEHTLVKTEIVDGDAFYPERTADMRPVWCSGNISSSDSFDYSYSTYVRFIKK